jgi:hypothetical protein
MKTSNYILIAFFAFIIGATLTLSIDSIGHENEDGRIVNEADIKKEKFTLPEFKVLVVEDNARYYVEESDGNSIQLSYLKDLAISPDFYRISEDTLYVNIVSTSLINVHISCQNLSSIIAKNKVYVRFNSLVTDHLQMDLDHAELSIREFQATSIDIQALHSVIRLHEGKIDILSARLTDESTISSSSNINKVDIEKDSSSNYNLH